MRKVYVRLYVDAIIRMDEGVELSEMLNEAELKLEHPDNGNTFDVEQLDVINHEVTDSK